MMTSKKRIDITLPNNLAIYLKKMAHRDGVPQETKAVELLECALEFEEDLYFSMLAEKRDTPDAKYLSHEEAWKRIHSA